jgi:hypothetical protein
MCEPSDLITRDPSWGEPKDELARLISSASPDARRQPAAVLSALAKLK